ncbi:MAG TPA: DNA mismatch repair endonuclease MutL [Chloroflexi bacterium]|jgi:DNA mismatch repair protein MutL|nr:DNA mismatch repair endonuclease MutL [Chloroflexota bacterium]HAF19046.1 DNA mismatch repair endonuclease MutL [Chloroflexota bacterium]
MTEIHVLAPEVADAIAAGEVVERPASVVKELVENALDADARRIGIDVRGAGRTSIRVSDDGSGIPAEELPLAFVRHATSKVTALSDLDAITSLGFRGEALASIAAVADVEGTSAGARIHIRAGEVIEHGAGPLLTGVTIEVRDLFANVPARLKFLKSDATEVAAIKDVVTAFALLHPHVRFQLTIDGRAAVSSAGDGDRRRAFASVHGAAVAAEMLDIVGLPLVSGMVSQPRLSRGSRDGLVLAVNGRPITSRPLLYALEDCYQGRLERGRHPIAAIDIGIDAALVDVNVHPAKREVRFRDEGAVFAALQRAVRSALGASEPVRYQTSQPASAVAAARAHVPQLVVHGSALLPMEQDVPSPASAGVLRPIGQVGPGYLVAEGPQGLVLVDQHAAHERVLYNRLLERLRTGLGASQPLLMPQAVDLEPSLIAAAADHRADLATLGLEYEEFGPRSLRITAVPVEMPAGRATAAVQETLAALSETRGDQAMHKAAAALACHSAVRFGDVLELAEQRRLLADLETAEESITCPHGRPTRLVVEWQELTRHFRRNY